MAVHTGEVVEGDGDYYGPTVNRVARLRGLAAGGQVLVSQATAELITDHLPADSALVECGEVHLEGLARPERLYVLVAAGMNSEVAVLVATHRPRARMGQGYFVGREGELHRLLGSWGAAARGFRRAVLLAGEPGIGKTRLAAELATALRAPPSCTGAATTRSRSPSSPSRRRWAPMSPPHQPRS